MIYTQWTKRAMQIAYDAHKNQKDKSGLPYIFHPIHLAEQMHDENSTIVALLHDVVEDTNISIEILISEGFNQDVIEAIKCLTHLAGITYEDYIYHIKNNALATKVKLVDLAHNSQIERFDTIDEVALKRLEKYKNAIKILST